MRKWADEAKLLFISFLSSSLFSYVLTILSPQIRFVAQIISHSQTYENKDELKNEINKSFAKYISEFNDIPEPLKDKRIDEVDRTPA